MPLQPSINMHLCFVCVCMWSETGVTRYLLIICDEWHFLVYLILWGKNRNNYKGLFSCWIIDSQFEKHCFKGKLIKTLYILGKFHYNDHFCLYFLNLLFPKGEKICCNESCKKCPALYGDSLGWNKIAQMCKYCKILNDRRQINNLKFYKGVFLGLMKLKLILYFLSSNTESFVLKNISLTLKPFWLV